MSATHDPTVFRTGPVGRFVRLGWAAAAAWTLISIVDSRGAARFRPPHILSEPSAWLLHALLLSAFVVMVGAVASAFTRDWVAKRIQVMAVVAAFVAVAAAGAIGRLGYGAVWGFPLADIVWYFDVAMLIIQLFAFVLAAALGTPGCEIGVWPELIARARGTHAQHSTNLACIIGIHLIDGWESRRRQNAGNQESRDG